MINVLLVLVFYLAMMGGAIWLQIFLSKKTNKWFGLILPIITLAFSLIFVINIRDTGSAWQNTITIASTLLLANIPTAILLAIYFACREKLKRKSQIDKMSIQDLE